MAVNKNFVVKNGLEVGNDLIIADADVNRIGIGLSVPQYNLHVSGGIAATTFYVIGNISAGGTTGVPGSLLRIGDSGVEWTPTPGTRTSQIFTATSNQTVFDFVHTVGLVDVFINGVKLANSEYLDGATTITLLTPAFAGDIVEIIGYTIYGVGAGVSGISGLTILEEGSVTGAPTAVTSLNFVGADITAAGTGAGVTVTVIPSRWNIGSGSSIYKLGYVGIGTTNPTADLTVDGDSIFVGHLSVKNSYNDGVRISSDERKLVSGIVTTNQLYVSGIPYSTLNLSTKVSNTIPTGSQSITLNDSDIQLTQVGDKLSIAGIFDRVNIIGVGTTSSSPFNQTFLTTSLSTSVGAGSTLIGLASSTGISIGSSLSISGIFDNIPVQYITTVLTDDGIKPAVQIRPSDTYGFVISVGTTVGFSSVVDYRSAVFIGAGNTHNGPIPTATDATLERIITPNGVGIFSGSSSTDMVRITQQGTGNALLVDDEQNPDSSPFVIDANGGVGIGTTIPSSSSKLTVVADGASLFNFANSLIDCTGDLNDYTQLNIRNSNPGDLASGDLTVTADTGNDDSYFVDLGINNSGFSTDTWTINGILDAYLYGAATNLSIGVDSPNKYVSFFAGGTLIENEKARINDIGVGIGTTNPRFALEVGAVGASGTSLLVNGDARITGILTVGTASITIDGDTNTITVPNLVVTNSTTGVTASGVGITVRDGGGDLGSASVIDFGNNLTVSFASGIATITGAAGGGGSSQWVSTAAGIHTLSNVGIGTTNPTSALTVKGNTSFETLNVSGVSTSNDIIYANGGMKVANDFNVTYGNNAELIIGYWQTGGVTRIRNQTAVPFEIDLASNANSTLTIKNNSNTLGFFSRTNVELYNSGTKRFETIGAGVTVTGTTFTNQLSVSGVSTLTSNVSVGGTISVNGGVKLATNNPTIVGTSGTVGEIKQIGGAPFFYDGSAWREFVLSSGTPVSVPADTEWDNVVFRATFDTDFTDAKFGATPVLVSSGSTIVGAAVTIGTGAFRNDGTAGAGVSYAYRSDYDFTGSWTIEFWMYVDSGPNSNKPVSLISMHSPTGIGTSGNLSLSMYRDGSANVYIGWFNQNHPSYKNGYAIYGTSGVGWGSLAISKWNHFALVREASNGSLHFYVNGIEQSNTTFNNVIDNDILHINGNGLHFGGDTAFTIGSYTFNSTESADVIFDDVRISCGVGTAGQRYNSIGISTYATFTPPSTALPTTGTLSSYVQPPGDKYGEIALGGSPTWRGTSGVTVSQQSSGNYRVSFASTYTNANDYFVLTQAMDQGFASYVGVARSTTHVDFAINRESDNSAVNTGSLSVQIKNHI